MPKRDLIERVRQLPKFEDTKKLLVENEEGELEPQEHFKPITRVGSDKAEAIVSDRYTLVQHEDAFLRVLEALPEDIGGEVVSYRTKAAMRILPEGKNVGIWVLNSLDASTMIRVKFFKVTDGTDVFIPKPVIGDAISGAEYDRRHVGEKEKIEREYENFLETTTIERVQAAWNAMVGKLARRKATQEDLEVIGDAIGKKGEEELGEWMNHGYLSSTGEVVRREPSIWELIVKAVKIVSDRQFKSGTAASRLNAEENVRKLSTRLLAYALKEA